MNQFRMGFECPATSPGYMSGVFKDPRAPIGDFQVLFLICNIFLPVIPVFIAGPHCTN